MATLSKKHAQPKTLTIRGVAYKLRYVTQDGAGPVRAVLDTDKLQGEFGDEWIMVKQPNGTFAPAP